MSTEGTFGLDDFGDLADVIGAVPAIGASLARTVGAFRAIAERRRRNSTRRSRTIPEVLGLSAELDWHYWLPTSHPATDGSELRDADVDALEAAIGSETADALSLYGGVADFGDPRDALEDSLMLIGSPESEPLTRLIFGYRTRDDGHGTRFQGGTVPLVYRWEEELDTGKPILYCRHQRSNGVIAVRPNWPLVVADGSLVPRYPSLTRQGELAEDFLLITSVPNFISESALRSGAQIVSIAGLHGIGTSAALTLVRNDSAVDALTRGLQALPARRSGVQVVVRVTQVGTDSGGATRAASVHVEDVVAITMSPDDLDRARSTLANELPAWRDSFNSSRNRSARMGVDLVPPLTPNDRRILEFVARRRAIDLEGM